MCVCARFSCYGDRWNKGLKLWRVSPILPQMRNQFSGSEEGKKNTYFTAPWEEAQRVEEEVEEMKSSSVGQWC